MTILRDVFDIKDSVNKEIKINARGSITREANTGVLQFPVLVSSALSLEEVTTISKALERQYVSFVAIMTSMDSVSDDKSIKSYMKKIHQNPGELIIPGLRESVLFSYRDLEFINNSSLLEASEKASVNLLFDEGGYNEEETFVTPYDYLKEECKQKANKILEKVKKEGCKVYKTSDSEQCVNIKNESTGEFNQIFFVTDMNEDIVGVYNTSLVLKEESKFNELSYVKKIIGENYNLLEQYESDLEESILNNKFTPKGYSIIGGGDVSKKYNLLGEAAIEYDLNKNNLVGAIAKPGELRSYSKIDDSRTDSNITRDILKDNDVKKANELAPTLMHLKTYFRDQDNGLHAVDYMIGVKTVVHKISSQSMMDNTIKAVKKGRSFFSIMKLTTGETSFFKDFVFAVSSIKEDIRTKFKDNPWWNSLMRKRKFSKILAAINFSQQLVPNTTIVLTMDEVVKIKAEHGIDVQNYKTAKAIMDQLFLMGLVIVDSSTEVSYFLFDGRNGFEEYSFNSLEKENSNSAKEIKNIMQVLGRM